MVEIEYIKYDNRYDSYYNETKDYWISARCKNCIENSNSIIKDKYECTQSCQDRPEKPSGR